jgi:GntR family transcriptional repressor for pyruvate dehydrogenase complex
VFLRTAPERIEDYILASGLGPGDQLPSEREFAELLGMSRTAVREAVKQLNQKGLIRSSLGRGLFVGDASGDAVLDSLRTLLHLRRGSLGHVMEVRAILEPHGAQLAAARASEDDLVAIRGPLEEKERRGREHATSARAGTAFHLAVAGAAHNPLLLGLIEPAMALMDRTRAELEPYLRGWRDENASDHRVIFEAIARRDPSGAARAIARHLDAFEEVLTRLVPEWRGLAAPAAGGPTATA